MNIYDHVVSISTSNELAKLLRDMSDETARYRGAYYAAKAFIEASTSENPPEDSGELYDKFTEAGRGL